MKYYKRIFRVLAVLMSIGLFLQPVTAIAEDLDTPGEELGPKVPIELEEPGKIPFTPIPPEPEKGPYEEAEDAITDAAAGVVSARNDIVEADENEGVSYGDVDDTMRATEEDLFDAWDYVEDARALNESATSGMSDMATSLTSAEESIDSAATGFSGSQANSNDAIAKEASIDVTKTTEAEAVDIIKIIEDDITDADTNLTNAEVDLSLAEFELTDAEDTYNTLAKNGAGEAELQEAREKITSAYNHLLEIQEIVDDNNKALEKTQLGQDILDLEKELKELNAQGQQDQEKEFKLAEMIYSYIFSGHEVKAEPYKFGTQLEKDDSNHVDVVGMELNVVSVLMDDGTWQPEYTFGFDENDNFVFKQIALALWEYKVLDIDPSDPSKGFYTFCDQDVYNTAKIPLEVPDEEYEEGGFTVRKSYKFEDINGASGSYYKVATESDGNITGYDTELLQTVTGIINDQGFWNIVADYGKLKDPDIEIVITSAADPTKKLVIDYSEGNNPLMQASVFVNELYNAHDSGILTVTRNTPIFGTRYVVNEVMTTEYQVTETITKSASIFDDNENEYQCRIYAEMKMKELRDQYGDKVSFPLEDETGVAYRIVENNSPVRLKLCVEIPYVITESKTYVEPRALGIIGYECERWEDCEIDVPANENGERTVEVCWFDVDENCPLSTESDSFKKAKAAEEAANANLEAAEKDITTATNSYYKALELISGAGDAVDKLLPTDISLTKALARLNAAKQRYSEALAAKNTADSLLAEARTALLTANEKLEAIRKRPPQNDNPDPDQQGGDEPAPAPAPVAVRTTNAAAEAVVPEADVLGARKEAKKVENAGEVGDGSKHEREQVADDSGNNDVAKNDTDTKGTTEIGNDLVPLDPTPMIIDPPTPIPEPGPINPVNTGVTLGFILLMAGVVVLIGGGAAVLFVMFRVR